MTPERDRFRGALAWSFALNGGREGLTALLTFVIAAILGPTVFGTVAMALAYVFFLQMFVEHGIGAAIVQREHLGPDHLDAAFWSILGLSLGLSAVGFALSGSWAELNRLPELERVIDVLLLVVPLQGLSVVQQAILQRDLEFRSLAIRANFSSLVGGGVGLAMAFYGFGIWALVAQQVLTAFMGVLVLWALTPWRPRLGFSLAALGDLVAFSAGTLLGAVGSFVNARLDAVLMGILFGPTAVGIFRLANRLVNVFVSLTARSVQAVALPEFSRLQGDPGALREGILRCVRISSIVSIPALAILGTASGEVIALLGSEWTDASVSLTLLCVAGVIQGLTLFLGPLMQALGRPYALASLLWAYAIPSATAYLMVSVLLQEESTWIQAAGIAGARAGLFAFLFFPISILVACRLVELNPGRLVRAMLPSISAGMGSVAAISALKAFGPPDFLASGFRTVLILSIGGFVSAVLLLSMNARLRATALQAIGVRRWESK